MRSLRRLSVVTFSGTAFLLAVLIFIGLRHNNLAQDYSSIVQESESTIFLYTTIQDQATEGLLSRNRSQLLGAAKELEQLHSRYVALIDNPLIPTQFKLSFLQELDLGLVVVNLRNLAENTESDELILRIMGQLRHINKQFLQFDRIVVNEMRNRVMNYQKNALIVMGMIITLTIYSLIIFYSRAVKPVKIIAEQAELALKENKPLHLGKSSLKIWEIQTLTSSFNILLQQPSRKNSDNLAYRRREAEFSTIINEATNRLNGIINYSQLLNDSFDERNIDNDQKQILSKIIDHGEKCAMILRKGIQ
ncbi:hypothetical protein [Desulfobulbus alkaliphilus]|uniref:hypothetical protein n=1 Tax=Desulfobulbus alkaliphilus TaxID=869814 RepID=UPI0019642E29|nr:hypothetical protein [Desulfobulbus alkaliphilus]MBM9537457.1 hypothetical protein [Desulfobulbus alkaliphilus]